MQLENTICKSSWIFIKIVHEETIDMLEMDDVVRAIEEVTRLQVGAVLDNHDIEFTKIVIQSNMINQKEQDCKK